MLTIFFLIVAAVGSWQLPAHLLHPLLELALIASDRTQTSPSGLRAGAGQSWQRLDYLDSLRAFAVLTVFITHVTEIFVRVTTRSHWLQALFYDLNMGRVGVVTFFAISGFLIPSSLYGATADGLRRFAVTRFFRLYPAYLLSLIPAIATYEIMTQGLSLNLSQALLNLTMVPRLFDAPMANGAYWTLEVELAFYVMCALLFYGGVLRNAYVLAGVMFVAFMLFYSSQRSLWGGLLNPALSGDAFFFWLNISCMFWGAVIRRWWDGDRLDALTVAMMSVVSFYWLAWMPSLYLLDRTGAVASPGLDSRLVAGYAIGLWLFVFGLFVVRIRWRPIVWFGRISYSFYLDHQAGLYLPYWLTLQVPAFRQRSMILYLLAAFVMSTLLASASYYYVERRFISWGRKLS